MSTLENFPYDELTIGQTASFTKTLTEEDILLFAAASGDVNPVHLDEEFASTTQFGGRIAHGMWTGALISAGIALTLPGPGSIYLGQNLTFRKPVMLGDTITISLEVTEKLDDKQFVTLDCKATNQHGKAVAYGTAQVLAPSEKMVIEKPAAPKVSIS